MQVVVDGSAVGEVTGAILQVQVQVQLWAVNTCMNVNVR